MKSLFILFIFISFCSVAQTWVPVTTIPALGRDDGLAFSIEDKGYVVTGNQGGFTESNRLWEYDAHLNSWAEKTAFPGVARQYSVAIVIDESAYVIGGIAADGTPLKDVWKYIQHSNSWVQLSDFPGNARWSAFGVAWNYKGYFGTGTNQDSTLSDMWRFEPELGKWTQLDAFPGGARRETIAIPVTDVCFVGMGFSINPIQYTKTFYRFSFLTEKWGQIADYPGVAASYSTGLGLGTVGFCAGGYSSTGTITNEVYRINRAGIWTQEPNFPETGIRGMAAFTLGNNMYFGTGLTDGLERSSRFYTYNTSKEQDQTIFVFPNPTRTDCVVISPENAELSLFALTGELVFHAFSEADQLVLIPKQANGIYLLKIKSANTEELKKIVFE